MTVIVGDTASNHHLDKYLKIFAVGLQNTLVYRWNFLLRVLFEIVPLFGTVYLWRAIFGTRETTIGGYQFHSMVYYFLLTALFSSLITPTDDEWQIAADIRDGQINTLLVKPVSYFAYRLGLFFGYRVTSSLFTLPIVLLIFTYFHSYITLPQSFSTWIIASISLFLAALLQFFLAYAIAMIAFWLLEISTVVFIVFSFEYFLSGHMFPLDLMPAWFRSAQTWLPFTYELYFPVAVFQEKITGQRLVEGLLIQFCWVIVVWIIGNRLWARGLRRFQAVGG